MVHSPRHSSRHLDLGLLAMPTRASLRWRFVTEGLIALCAGYLHACSVAAPWSGQPVWWLQIIALAVLVGLVQHTHSIRAAALHGWLFATSWITGSVWWLYISMHTYGGLAAPLAALAVLALCGVLALYYAAACAFYKRFGALAQQNNAQAAIIFAACWLLAELARDTWFTGFPWAAGGYAHVDGPLQVYARHVGVYGVGFLASVLAVLLAAVVMYQELKLRVAVAATALLLWGAANTYWFTPELEAVQTKTAVALLQGNIPQGEKFDNSKGIPFALEWYAKQLSQTTATLVVAPETAIPLLPQQLPEGYWATLQTRFKTGKQAALVGVPLGTFEDGYTNSVVAFAPPAQLPGALNVMQPQPYRYDKHHLVPFGEFIPPLFKWFTQMMNIPLGDFNRGAIGQASFAWDNQRWAPNICYEDLFGDELAARFVDPSVAPTVLVNISNIGWFGNSIAIDQHLQISRMRALEFDRPMLRATNTGPTVIINHLGQVTHSLPRHTLGVLVGEVEGRTGTTPYAWWAGRFGLWPLWLLAIAVLLAAALVKPRAKRKLA
jgi:apolipoprotein N-acyltransferase